MNTAILFEVNTVYALLIGAAIGSITAFIGSLMITKRMALMSDALAHLTLPGIALALKYQFDVSIGAFPFLIIGVFFIWLLEKKTDLSIETLSAIIFTTSTAITFLFLPEEKTQAALLGDISQLNWYICCIALIISAITFFITHHIFKRMVLITVSPDIAHSLGINVSKYNFIYLSCIALMIVLGIRIIGGLMTAALVAIPASTSKNLSTNLFQYTYLSLFFGGFSCIVGIIISLMIQIPVGPTIILVNASLFLVSVFRTKF